jgi:hypothetical protein
LFFVFSIPVKFILSFIPIAAVNLRIFSFKPGTVDIVSCILGIKKRSLPSSSKISSISLAKV